MKINENKNKYELISKTPQELLQPFFIELAISGGYDELLYIYDNNKPDVEMYLSQDSRTRLAKIGLDLFSSENKVEKLLQKERQVYREFDRFIKTIKLGKIKSSTNLWLKNKLIDYYNHFVRFSKIYRFTESFYSPQIEQTIRKFITSKVRDKYIVNQVLSVILNPSVDEKVTEKRRKILSSINTNKKFSSLCESVRKVGIAKLAMRTRLDGYWSFLENFLEEIAKKILISPIQIKSLFCQQLATILSSQKQTVDKDLLDKANRRSEFFVARKVDSNYKYYTGQDAKRFAESVRQVISDKITEFKGDVVSTGNVIGKVIIIPYGVSKKGQEKLKHKMAMVEMGDIIVTTNAGPEMLSACHKAGAIVADEGGILSHAAIISRELEIPGIINTKIATKVLQDGDVIEMDANKGIINILKKHGR